MASRADAIDFQLVDGGSYTHRALRRQALSIEIRPAIADRSGVLRRRAVAGKLVNDEAHFSISLQEFETDRTQLWYLEHHASCASLATFDDAAWRLKDPNGGCVEVDSDSVICFSLNSN